ncbi:RNA polymerase sigma factor [Acidobacteriota bacterium]
MELEQLELIKTAQNGDKEAFESLACYYRSKMLNLAFSITGNVEDAKDITQDTFLRAFKYVYSFRPQDKMLNWLYKININLCRDLLRQKEKHIYLLGFYLRKYQNFYIFGDHLLIDFKDNLEMCLKFLTPRERTVFILRDIRELSIKETAQILNSTEASVKKLLFSARKKLKDRLKQFYPSIEKNSLT